MILKQTNQNEIYIKQFMKKCETTKTLKHTHQKNKDEKP